MSRASRARRIALKAAYGGGGIGLVGAVLAGLLVGQARYARRIIPPPEGAPPNGNGGFGAEFSGPPLTLAVLGDSSAAGLGVDDPRDTPGALLAAGLAQVSRRPVRLLCVAVIGAESQHLHSQVDAVLADKPHAVAILIGGNDVTHRVKPQVAVGHLSRAVRRLVSSGAQVVVGTCPDLGTIQPIQPPLRWVARSLSRQLAAAQTIAVVEAGGRSVSLGSLLGPDFAARPDQMFSADRFHPSATGYASAAAAMLPSLAASLGFGEHADDAPSRARGEGVMPLAQAAVEAVDQAGTELSAPTGEGRGRWVELRHRIRMFTRSPEDLSVDQDGHQGEAAVEAR